MTSYLCGRFEIPHIGHSKAFALCDAVLAEESPSLSHRYYLRDFFGTDQVLNVGLCGLTDWATEFAKPGDSFVLDSNRVGTGNALANLGYSVSYLEFEPSRMLRKCRSVCQAVGLQSAAEAMIRDSLQVDSERAKIAALLVRLGY